MQPVTRKIASNRLWTPDGVVHNPLVEFDDSGRMVSVVSCPEPDREAMTEFYSGVMIPNFPNLWRETFAAMLLRRNEPLEKLLAESITQTTTTTCTVIISGLNYSPLQLTDKSEIRVVQLKIEN